MTLGNQVEWGLHCMAVLGGLPSDTRISSKFLAEYHGVPKEYLLKSLQLLSNAGLVDSSLGPKGGYRLAKAADQITFLEIVEAIEGRQNTFQCSEIRKNNPCIKNKKSFSAKCLIARSMHQADEAWRESLRKTKLSEIIKEFVATTDPEQLRANAEWFSEHVSQASK
ncbi:RrF2 family transcriptional regulator [Bdellovibrio sp. HCB337]|uniref:RrF2 family transcriptional regulator n=1 Tax=Bdellovibrio sp. HCB337 TaxID=3394358 RepID=UPI0039A6BD5E